MHAATSGKTKLHWTPDLNSAFKELEEKLTSPPDLSYPDFQKNLVDSDESAAAMGAVLAQSSEDGEMHPIQKCKSKHEFCGKKLLGL